jgi:hypothetical protein
LGIAQKPTVDVHGGCGGVVEFNRIFERRIGVGERFVDDDRLQQAVIAPAGRLRAGEREDVCRAIQQSPAGDVVGLRAKAERINQSEVRAVRDAVNEERFARASQSEVHVVATITGVVVGNPFHKAICADKTQRARAELVPSRERWIICQRNRGQVHRTIRAVEQLKPVIASGRIGHPLVEAERSGVAQDGSAPIHSAGGCDAQQPPLATAQTDGQVVHLRTIFDKTDDLAVGVEEINATAFSIK